MTPLRAGPALAAKDHADLRRRMIFDYGKWNPQWEDTAVLAPYPLILSRSAWEEVRTAAEALAREVLAAEDELRQRPDLQRRLGLPRAVRAALAASARGEVRSAVRYVRFDFHPTTAGWRISEANTDVPGGLVETAGLSELVRSAVGGGCVPLGEPAGAIAARMAAQRSIRSVALVHATAYTDDRQEMEFLRRRLAERGIEGHLTSPTHLRTERGKVILAGPQAVPIDAVFRFFPAEWLANLPRGGCRRFCGLPVPHCNPPSALLTQSKRLPLVWDELATPMPTWRAFLPETRDPRGVRWRDDPGWVLKAALGRVGEEVAMPGVTPQAALRGMVRSARWHPAHWIAQRRFDAVAIPTPDGPRYPCLGVFVVNDGCAGVYGRLAAAPLINSRAQDAAVFVEAAAQSAAHRPCRTEEPIHVQCH